jgi:hypothetical protein
MSNQANVWREALLIFSGFCATGHRVTITDYHTANRHYSSTLVNKKRGPQLRYVCRSKFMDSGFRPTLGGGGVPLSNTDDIAGCLDVTGISKPFERKYGRKHSNKPRSQLFTFLPLTLRNGLYPKRCCNICSWDTVVIWPTHTVKPSFFHQSEGKRCPLWKF